MDLLLLGMNHRTASLAEREALALDPETTNRILADVLGQGTIGEAFALSTCNRTEFYLVAADLSQASDAIRSTVVRIKGTRLAEPGDSLYQRVGSSAATHLFRVASGIDSMVLGESEILGQVKDAFALARDAGATGPLLDRLLETALRVGKRARSETAIGSGVVSVVSAACELARHTITSLEAQRVVVIGAGDTARLAAQHLGRHFPGGVTIVNRSRDRAEALAAEIGGRARSLEDLAGAIVDADLIVSATRAPGTLLNADTVAREMARRPERPMTIIDLAVPRDVAPEAGSVPSVTLHSIDAIQLVVDRCLEQRASEVPRVEAIVDEESLKFDVWKRGLDAAPVVRDLREHFERVRLEELDRAFGSASDDERARADRLTRALVNRLLHLPTVRLKDADPASDEGASRLRAARELFALGGRPADHVH
jgi:glutamyl-tRNA reductase